MQYSSLGPFSPLLSPPSCGPEPSAIRECSLQSPPRLPPPQDLYWRDDTTLALALPPYSKYERFGNWFQYLKCNSIDPYRENKYERLSWFQVDIWPISNEQSKLNWHKQEHKYFLTYRLCLGLHRPDHGVGSDDLDVEPGQPDGSQLLSQRSLEIPFSDYHHSTLSQAVTVTTTSWVSPAPTPPSPSSPSPSTPTSPGSRWGTPRWSGWTTASSFTRLSLTWTWASTELI